MTWQWFNEDGTPGSYLWAVLTLVAAIIFTTLGVMIWRLGRKWRNNKPITTETTTVDPTKVSPVQIEPVQVEPVQFEKRGDNQLEYYDPTKVKEEAEQIAQQRRMEEEKRQQEEERLQAMMAEEERKRKELEAKERAFEEKRQREEEARMERERKEAERLAEKERIRAEKEAAKEAAKETKQNRNKNQDVNDFFAQQNEDDASAFNFNSQDETADNENGDDAMIFWNQAESPKENKVEPQRLTITTKNHTKINFSNKFISSFSP